MRRPTTLYAWVAEHTGDEVRDLATAFRIPNAPVANGATVESLEHFVARGSFVTNPAGFHQPAHPYRISGVELRPPSAAPRLGEHTEHHRTARRAPRTAGTAPNTLPLRGIRVLDLTTFWAGPSCTHPMALLGAEVIHVESARRPDGTRLIAGVPVTEAQWWERQPIFAALNTNKKDITLDLATERGRELLTRLIATADVVAENYTPRVLDQLGLDYRCGATDQPQRHHVADARVRPRRSVARQPGFRLRHRGRRRHQLADRLSGPQSLRAVLGRRPQRRAARPQRRAAGPRASAAHGGGLAGRGRDGRRRAQHRRRAGHRVHRLRRRAAARRQPRSDGRAAEPLPHKRDPTSSAATTRGWPSRWPPTVNGKRCGAHSATRSGPPTRRWPPTAAGERTRT